MLFLVSGASGSGKTTLVHPLADRVSNLAVHELGEFADRPWEGEPGWQWRRDPLQRALERAWTYERDGIDMMLTEGVLGELLAAPTATELEGIAVCLVDCGDSERLDRLRRRSNGAGVSPHELWNHLVWALWLRRHAEDPRIFAGPIRGDDDGGWAWGRWSGWVRGDARWGAFVLDTTAEAIETSVGGMAAWVEAQRALRDAGELPLSGDWSDRQR